MDTKQSKKERMCTRIQEHGENLLAIFPGAVERDPVKLCKKLRKLEGEAGKFALDYCNGDWQPKDENEVEWRTNVYLGKLCAILGIGFSRAEEMGIFINLDPRGYALKIGDAWVRANDFRLHRDMGGYGIIAPDITND